MKDFNNLIINNKKYDQNDLLNQVKIHVSKENWEGDFWRFIAQWLDQKPYVTVQTSGSTGQPKKIQIAKEKMLESAKNTCHFFQLKEGDNALLCLSAKHIGGMMMIVRAFYNKLNLHLVAPQANPLKDMESKIEFTAMVPYQAQNCIKASLKKTQDISHIIIGGGKISSELEQLITVNDIQAYSTFGMTETISHIALQKIGKDQHYTCLNNIRIDKSKEGTLVIHAPNLLDKALATNDLIDMINHSQFKWLGRKDFAIESGGIKIIPEIIEQKLEPYLKRNFIISSRPSNQFNNEVILIIEGEKYTIDSSIFKALSKFEKPKAVYFVDKMIYTPTGKIKRRATQKLVL